jgi:hypothetical protein
MMTRKSARWLNTCSSGQAIRSRRRSTAQDELLLKASARGAVEIIMKPFEFRQLVGAVERALETT